MTILTQANLLEVLDYNPETGELIWKARVMPKRRGSASWNSRYAGKRAMTAVGAKGHLLGTVLSKRIAAHRVIWMMQTGKWPDQIDHINGNPADNRWSNLRSVNTSENCRNKKQRRTLPLGIYPRRDGIEGFVATIGYREDGQKINKHIGSYTSLDAAKAARRAAEEELGFHPNHGRHS